KHHSYRFFFSSRRRHTRSKRDWSSDVCSSDLIKQIYDELKRQGDSLDKVISSIQGDEAFGTKGMLHRIRENEMSLREQKLKNDKRYAEVQQRTQKNEDRFNSVYNRFMGFGAAITVITTGITLLLNFWGVFDDPKIKYLPMPAQESVQVAPAA